MSELDKRSITIITAREPLVSGNSTLRGGTSRDARRARQVVEKAIEPELLQNALRRFLATVRTVVDVDGGRTENYVLDEIQFSAEIGADGEFKLLGTGIGVSATSALTFTLRRIDENKDSN